MDGTQSQLSGRKRGDGHVTGRRISRRKRARLDSLRSLSTPLPIPRNLHNAIDDNLAERKASQMADAVDAGPGKAGSETSREGRGQAGERSGPFQLGGCVDDDDMTKSSGSEAFIVPNGSGNVRRASDGDIDVGASTAGVDDETAQLKPPHPDLSDGSDISECDYSDAYSEPDEERLNLRYDSDSAAALEEDVRHFLSGNTSDGRCTGSDDEQTAAQEKSGGQTQCNADTILTKAVTARRRTLQQTRPIIRGIHCSRSPMEQKF